MPDLPKQASGFSTVSVSVEDQSSEQQEQLAVKCLCRDLYDSRNCVVIPSNVMLRVRGMVLGFKNLTTMKEANDDNKKQSEVEYLVIDDGSGKVASILLDDHIRSNESLISAIIPGLIVDCSVRSARPRAENEEKPNDTNKTKDCYRKNMHENFENRNFTTQENVDWYAESITVWKAKAFGQGEHNDYSDDSLDLLLWHSIEVMITSPKRRRKESNGGSEKCIKKTICNDRFVFDNDQLFLGEFSLEEELYEMIHSCNDVNGVSLVDLGTILDLPLNAVKEKTGSSCSRMGNGSGQQQLQVSLSKLQLEGRIYLDSSTGCYHPL